MPESKTGPWQELNQETYDQAWDRFYKDFRFRPHSSGSRGIKEPVPSITYSIASIYCANHLDRENDLTTKILMALIRCTEPDEALVALEWQNPATSSARMRCDL